MQMTERMYLETKQKIKDLKGSLDNALLLQREAAEGGDLKENEEYHTARADAERISKEISKLQEQVDNAEIVMEDNSPRITLGSTIEICLVDDANQPISDPRILRYEAAGDTILQHVLGANSSLGKAIYNGTDNVYTIPDNGGMRYRVKKIKAWE